MSRVTGGFKKAVKELLESRRNRYGKIIDTNWFIFYGGIYGYITMLIMCKLTKSELDSDCMIIASGGLIVTFCCILLGIVSLLIWLPERILFGKEE